MGCESFSVVIGCKMLRGQNPRKSLTYKGGMGLRPRRPNCEASANVDPSTRDSCHEDEAVDDGSAQGAGIARRLGERINSTPTPVFGRNAQISLKKCATWRAFGWGNCGLGTLDGGLVAGRAALRGQHFRSPIGRSQAGEAPQILCGCGEEELVSCPIRTP
jgi:hypothetical protein